MVMSKKLLVIFITLFLLTSCGAKQEQVKEETATWAVEVESTTETNEVDASSEVEKKLKLIEEAKKKLEENLLGDEPTSFLKGLFITQVSAAEEEETALSEDDLAEIEEELEWKTNEELLDLIGETLEEAQELSEDVEDPEEAEALLLAVQDISEEVAEEIQTIVEIAWDETILSDTTELTNIINEVTAELDTSISKAGERIEKKFLKEWLSEEEIQSWKEKRKELHDKKKEEQKAFREENKKIREQVKAGTLSKEQAKEIKKVKKEEFKVLKNERKNAEKKLREAQKDIKKKRKAENKDNIETKKENIKKAKKEKKEIKAKKVEAIKQEIKVKKETKKLEVELKKSEKKEHIEQKKKEIKAKKIEKKIEIEKQDELYSDETSL